MPCFLFWSDLHLEHDPDFNLPDPSLFKSRPDGLILGGDTHTGLRHIEAASRFADHFDCPVVLVTGNHEPYGMDYDDFRLLEADLHETFRKAGHDIHLLYGGSVTIAGVRITGAPLWTDMAYQSDINPLARIRAGQMMNDYRCISRRANPDGRFTPEDSIALHRVDKQVLFDTLSQSHDGPTIVVTHHMPVVECVHPAYRRSEINRAFTSDLLGEILDFDFHTWIFGHSHNALEMNVQGSRGMRRFVTNPRGYPGESTPFDPMRCLCL